MSLIRATGFNFMATGNADLALRGISAEGWISGSNVNIIASALNGAGLRMSNNTGNFGFQTTFATVNIGGSRTEIYTGFAFRMTNRVNNLNYNFFHFTEVGVTNHLMLRSNANGSIDVCRSVTNNAGALATSATGVILNNTWHYIEVYARINDTTGQVIVKVDNNEVINVTNVDTRNGGTGIITGLGPLHSSSNGAPSDYIGSQQDYDDWYICDTTGTVNNSFLGPVRIDGLLPNADGATTDFTPFSGTDNFVMVDEAIPNGDTDYNSSATIGHKDIFDLTSIPTPASVTVFGVVSRVRARASDLGTVELQPSIISSATEADGARRFLGTSYNEYSDLFEQNPNGNVPWTDTTVNALQQAYRIPT